MQNSMQQNATQSQVAGHRFRTIGAAAQYFRNEDPDTAISAYAIRRGILAGRIPHVKNGGKYLVSIEVLERFFAGEIASAPQVESVGIRKIDC